MGSLKKPQLQDESSACRSLATPAPAGDIGLSCLSSQLQDKQDSLEGKEARRV